MSYQAERSISVLLSSIIFIFTVLFFISSCGRLVEDAANAVDTEDDANVVGTDVEDFEVTVTSHNEITFYTSLDAARPVERCVATQASAASQWIECVIDVEELDAFQNTFTLENSAPAEMCAYRGFRSYYYMFAYTAPAPRYVTYVFDGATGDVTDNTVRYFYPADIADGDYPDLSTPNNTGGTAAPSSMAFVGEDDVICPYDYSLRYEDGANCCDGTYISIAFNSLDTANYVQSDETDWGGDPLNCFAGPGVEDTLPKTEDGWPAYHITMVEGLGLQDTYVIDSPTNKNDRQVYLANYFTPADHQGSTTPVSLSATWDYGFGFTSTVGFPYYRFECLDSNFEVLARIDVRIREWNQIGYSEDGVNANADLTGVEETPFGLEPINDFSDWKDRLPAASHSSFLNGSHIIHGF